MNQPPKTLWRIENNAVHQYDFFAVSPNPNYAVYFHWGTTIPIEVNVHESVYIADGFFTDPQIAYEELRFTLERRLDYIQSIIDSLNENNALETTTINN